jgi:hypothetical protein
MFMHGEILHINCCSIILKSESSGGTLWGSMLFWNENNFKEFLSELQRLHIELKDILVSIRLSLHIVQNLKLRDICFNSKLLIQSINLLKCWFSCRGGGAGTSCSFILICSIFFVFYTVTVFFFSLTLILLHCLTDT